MLIIVWLLITPVKVMLGGNLLPHTLKNYYSININTTDSDGPLVLPPLPHGYTFVLTSSMMQMLTARGLVSGRPFDVPHAHIAKLRSMCKSCVGMPDIDMDVIGLMVFSLSLTGKAAI